MILKKTIRLLLFPIFLLAVHPMSAQTVDEAIFSEGIDYINCKITEMSFQDQQGQPHLASYQKVFPNCGIGHNPDFFNKMTTFMKGLQPFPKLTYQLSSNIDLYKKRYSDSYSDKQLYLIIQRDLFNSVFIKDFASRHPRFADLRGELLNYASILFEVDRGVDTYIDPTEEFNANERKEYIEETNDTEPEEQLVDDYRHLEGGDDTLELERDYVGERTTDRKGIPLKPKNTLTDTAEEDESAFSKYRILLVGFLLLALVFVLFRNNLAQLRPKGMTSAKASKNVINSEIEYLKQEIEGLKKTSHNLEEELEVLRYRLHSNKKTKNLPSNKSEPIPLMPSVNKGELIETIEPEPVKEQESMIGEVFYMPKPTSSGIFETAASRDYFKRAESVYQFTIVSEDGKKAEFEIYPDIATMIKALDDFESYLKPACKASSVIHISATKIITDKKGIAVRDNGHWRVIQKAHIHYS